MAGVVVLGAANHVQSEPLKSVQIEGQASAHKNDAVADGLAGKVGLLRTKSGTPRCTAFCLSKTLVATAGHCLGDGDGTADTPRSYRDLTYEPLSPGSLRMTRERTKETSAVVGLVSGGGAVSMQGPIEADRDWAVLRLQKPACVRGGLKLASPTVDHDRSLVETNLLAASISIGAGRVTSLTAARCKSVSPHATWLADHIDRDFASPNRLLFHECDTGAFASGSPLLQSTETGFEVIAMHVGSYVRSRVFLGDQASKKRLSMRPIANIAIRVDEFTRPVRDLLDSRPVTRNTQPATGSQVSQRPQ